PRPHIVTLTRGDAAEPSDDPADEQREARANERVWVEHDRGIASVWLARFGRRVLVFRARGMAAAPTLAGAPTGTWVAFHHAVREDSGERDVAKWIALRFVDTNNRVLEPSAPMLERDRDLAGVEQ